MQITKNTLFSNTLKNYEVWGEYHIISENRHYPRTDSIVGLMPNSGSFLLCVSSTGAAFALIRSFSKILSRQDEFTLPVNTYGDVVVISDKISATDFNDCGWQPKKWNEGKIIVRQTERCFNWRIAEDEISPAFSNGISDALSAVIIDTGHFPKNVDESIVQSAIFKAQRLGRRAGCIVLFVVEIPEVKTQDAIKRIPAPLRIARDFLLACGIPNENNKSQSLLSKKIALLKISSKSHVTTNADLMLFKNTVTGNSEIQWVYINEGIPDQILRSNFSQHIPAAYKQAIDFAVSYITTHGPQTAEILKEAARRNNIQSTTMRDGLTAAKKHSILFSLKTDTGFVWCLHGTTFKRIG